eukprot:6096800-Prymnesium_polylepis.1
MLAVAASRGARAQALGWHPAVHRVDGIVFTTVRPCRSFIPECCLLQLERHDLERVGHVAATHHGECAAASVQR